MDLGIEFDKARKYKEQLRLDAIREAGRTRFHEAQQGMLERKATEHLGAREQRTKMAEIESRWGKGSSGYKKEMAEAGGIEYESALAERYGDEFAELGMKQRRASIAGTEVGTKSAELGYGEELSFVERQRKKRLALAAQREEMLQEGQGMPSAPAVTQPPSFAQQWQESPPPTVRFAQQLGAGAGRVATKYSDWKDKYLK